MQASKLDSNNVETLLARVAVKLSQHDFTGVEKDCRFLLANADLSGTYLPHVHFFLGAAMDGLGRYLQALENFNQVVQHQPENLDAWYAKASVCSKLKLPEECLAAACSAYLIDPKNVKSLSNLAIAYQELKQYPEAVAIYQQVLDVDASDCSALLNVSFLLIKSGQALLAKRYCISGIDYWPHNIDFYINLAEAHIQSFDFEEARIACEAGLKINDMHAALTFKYGLVLAYLHDFECSRQFLGEARLIDPDVVQDYFPHLFQQMEVNKVMNKELLVVPELIYLNMASYKQRQCDWRDREFYYQFLERYVSGDNDRAPQVLTEAALHAISLPINASNRKKITQLISKGYSEAIWKKGFPPYKFQSRSRQKIRIGYISPDFRRHPVGLLTRQMYGLHDREKFQVYAYSLYKTSEGGDEVSQVISSSCDVFRDMSEMESMNIANTIHQDEIDILVDLAGYTAHARTDVLAMRPAPIQVAYLGFPGTMGADFIDYAITDSTVAPQGSDADWTECLIRLPNANIVFDTAISNAPSLLTKQELGLPENAIVFCCFNLNNKIDPDIFQCWLRLLNQVSDSVLWLVSTHLETHRRLAEQAISQGVDPARLIFAPFTSYADHVVRYQFADLFLDTLWHNAHTTAIDALWQGLPVITCIGNAPSSRLAASLLNALEMPELITNNLDEYEKLVIYYATNHQARNAMREKLKNKRYTSSLFNLDLTVKYIETAYQTIWQQYQNDLPTIAIDIPS